MKEDSLIWHDDKFGKLQVKFTYAIAIMDSDQNHITQVENQEKNIWKSLLHLDVQPKLCHFIWKACKETLPIRKGLVVARKIIDDPLCPICHNQEESMSHCLTTCPFVART